MTSFQTNSCAISCKICEIDSSGFSRYIQAKTWTKAVVFLAPHPHHGSEGRSHFTKRPQTRFCEVFMLTAAFLLLLTATVGPLLFGFLRGLGGHISPPPSADVSLENELQARQRDECEDHFEDDYWFFFNEDRSASN
jgi:hypothetical protein